MHDLVSWLAAQAPTADLAGCVSPRAGSAGESFKGPGAEVASVPSRPVTSVAEDRLPDVGPTDIATPGVGCTTMAYAARRAQRQPERPAPREMDMFRGLGWTHERR